MTQAPLSLGVIGSSAKENEHRLPLHPDHLARIPRALQQRITLEHGYGARFRCADRDLAPFVAGNDFPVLPTEAFLQITGMFDLKGGATRFVADTGVDDEKKASGHGSVGFSVWVEALSGLKRSAP